MATQGPNSPGSGADDAGVGTLTWVLPGNITGSDDSRSLCDSPGLGGTNQTHYLFATNFGFSIPSGATINGITVEVERLGTVNNAVQFVKDAVVSLIKNGTVTGSNKADTATKWPTTDTIATYGGPSDLWGTTLTDSDVNGSNFGAAISVNLTDAAEASVRAEVDHIRITVTYTLPGIVNIIKTSAQLRPAIFKPGIAR